MAAAVGSSSQRNLAGIKVSDTEKLERLALIIASLELDASGPHDLGAENHALIQACGIQISQVVTAKEKKRVIAALYACSTTVLTDLVSQIIRHILQTI